MACGIPGLPGSLLCPRALRETWRPCIRKEAKVPREHKHLTKKPRGSNSTASMELGSQKPYMVWFLGPNSILAL